MRKIILLFVFVLFQQDVFSQIISQPVVFSSSSFDRVDDIFKDSTGKVYILGSVGSPSMIRTTSYNIEQETSGSFVGIFDENGSIIKFMDVNFVGEQLYSITVDTEGNIFLTGRHSSYTFVAAKLDPEFNLLWSFKEGSQGGIYGKKIIVDKLGYAYIAGTVSSPVAFGMHIRDSCCPSSDFVIKVDPQGKLVWVKTGLGENLMSSASSIAFDQSGNIVMVGSIMYTGTYGDTTFTSYKGWKDVLVVKYTPTGNVIWANRYGGENGYSEGLDLVLDTSNNTYIVGLYGRSQSFGNTTLEFPMSGQDALIMKLDPKGQVTWAQGSGMKDSVNQYNSIAYYEGKVQVTGFVKGDYYWPTYTKPVVATYSEDGDLIWRSTLYEKSEGKGIKILFSSNKTSHLVGHFKHNLDLGHDQFLSHGEDDIFSIQIFDTARFNALSTINGKITLSDANCNFKNVATNLLVKASPGDYWGISNQNGDYTLHVDPGNYTVTPVIQDHMRNYLMPICLPVSSTISIDSNHQIVNGVDFNYELKEENPLLTVDIAHLTRLRRCSSSEIIVNYCNRGFKDQEKLNLKVILPTYVIATQSSVPWSEKIDSLLVFDIDRLKAGECRTIIIQDSVLCNDESIRGLTQCFKAMITEDEENIGSDTFAILVSAQCRDNGFVRVFVKNQGLQAMPDSAAYQIFLDTELVYQGKYKLNVQDSLVLNIPANGKTLRFEAYITSEAESKKSVTIEGCGGSSEATISKGFVEQFPQDDEAFDTEEHCLTIVDSYDPNDKQVSPVGLFDSHFVAESTELEYTIRFQNTGTDTAFYVMVQDTLSEYLDYATFQIGASSHPYEFKITGKGKPVLSWEFKNINLPDSATNKRASQGFVKFKIRQRSDNPKGTVIQNQASIYFDYNSPIVTNQVFNTVGLPQFLIENPLQVQYCNEVVNLPDAITVHEQLCEQDSVVIDASGFDDWYGAWKNIEGGGEIADQYHSQTKVRNLPYGENILIWEENYCDQKTYKIYKLVRIPRPEEPVVETNVNPIVELNAIGAGVKWYQDEALLENVGEGNLYQPEDIPCLEQSLYVTQTIEECESMPTKVTFNPEFQPNDFFVPNIITPNQDGQNDYFYIPELKGRNCLGGFISINIINRWGKNVFTSADEKFYWHAKHVPAGVYYVTIKYTNYNYTGLLNVLF